MQHSPVAFLAAAECKIPKLTARCVVILQSAHSIIWQIQPHMWCQQPLRVRTYCSTTVVH